MDSYKSFNQFFSLIAESLEEPAFADRDPAYFVSAIVCSLDSYLNYSSESLAGDSEGRRGV